MVLLLILGTSSRLLPGAEAVSCCEYPPDIRLLGPPPKPFSVKFDLVCNGSSITVFNNDSLSGPNNSASEASPATTSGESTLILVLGVIVGLMTVAFIIAVIVFLRVKIKHKQRLQIKPESRPDEEENYLYNLRIKGKKWSKDKCLGVKRKKKCNRTSSCGLLERAGSSSSSSVDAGYGGDVPDPDQPVFLSEEGGGDSSNTSGIGMSQPDLQQEGPDVVPKIHPHPSVALLSTENERLPVLTPIQYGNPPGLPSLYERLPSRDHESEDSWNTGLSDRASPEPSQIGPCSSPSPSSARRKRRKKRTSSKLGLVPVIRQDTVAMETISPRKSILKSALPSIFGGTRPDSSA